MRLKVLVDLVPNHTSDQHAWFQAALSSPDDPHRDLYYFRDGKPDGSPPNNWRSAFGGPAWTKDELSGQWYLHLFAPEQPDLDWWDPRVPAEFERTLRFSLAPATPRFPTPVPPALFHPTTPPHVARLGGGPVGPARRRAALLLLLGLPGQAFLYQGEELGLEEADVPPEARQDPLFIHTKGRQAGRDGCRVPLPWKKGELNAGFSVAQPWLPMPPGWDRFAVDAEDASAFSMLQLYTSALAHRRRLAPWLPPSS